MAKLDIQPVKSYWEDDLDIQPLDIQPIQEEVPLLKRLGSGVKRSWEGLKNTADVGITMPAAGLAGIFGQEKDQEELFRALNERIAAREKEGQSGMGAVEPGFAGKLAGVVATLPGQIAAMPVRGIETAKQFVDQGESLGRAYGAGAIDTAGNLAGLALPGVVQGGKLMRAASGAGIIAAQDTATRAAISGIAETQGAKEMFAPTLETAALAAVPGAALGVLTGKAKTQKALTPKKDIGAIIASESTGDVPAGFKAGEFAGDVNLDLFNKIKQEDAIRQQQEFADRMEAQRVMEAEQYAAQQFPEQSTTGLSTGEGVAGGRVINRAPVSDSGLMGLPAGELPRPVGLSTGEGVPGGRVIQRTPETSSGVMGVEPKPFDPFGSLAGNQPVRLRKTGRFGQQGGIDPEVFREGFKAATKALSKLTDMPWVKAAFPSPLFETNKDGSPKILLHGTTKTIHGELLPKAEGFHAGYTSSPHMFTGFRKGENTPKYTHRNIDSIPLFPEDGGGQLHPIVIKKGNYPYVDKDFGTWNPISLARKNDFILAVSKATGGKVGYFEAKDILNDFANDYGRTPITWSDAEVNERFSKLLKNQFGIDGFYYKNTAESVKREITKFGNNPKRASVYDDPTSFVTWNKNKYKSLFDNQSIPEQQARINKFGQGGSAPIIGDLAEGIVRLGAGLKAKFTGVKVDAPDTVVNPKSPENIAAKKSLRNKANAIGKKDSVYANYTTVEEALADLPAKDIGSNQVMASGNEAVIRRNSTNSALKFVRWLRTKAQTNTDALTAKYITGKDGFNETFRKLSDAEKMEVHEVIQELSKQRVDYSDTLADKLELTPAQRAFMEARGKALKAVLETANTVNKGLGFELIKALPGYSPGMFASTYVSLVGKYVGKGEQKRWVTEAVVNANSKWEYNQGLKYYKDRGMETITLDRRGLNTATKAGRNFDGTIKLLAALAEHDSRFADAKGVLDNFLKDQTKKLYNFDVHEMRKKGVEGNIGNKPWLDAKTNAREALEAEVNYIDEAFKYWNYQEMLNKTKQLVDDPKMEAYPNTSKYLDKYVKQVTGNNLHPLGAGANSFVDAVFEYIGNKGAKVGLNIPENPNRVFAGAREFGSALMMNIYAPAFAAIQLIQMFQSGIPEAMKIRNEMGLSPMDPVVSFGRAMTTRAWLAGLDALGKLEESKAPQYIKDAWEYAKKNGMNSNNTPAQMKDAYKWMREHGIDHYNEIQMSHEAAQNPKWTKAKNMAFWPTRLPEMMTRPTVFMWYADMFHQAGLRGEELHYTAKNATDYAMVNYHTDERPMVYQQLGVVGQSIGALRTYVHNAAEQQISRTKEWKQNPGAFLAMLGFTAGLMGVAGLPFYDEIDQWFVQPVTKRSARDWMSEALNPYFINGVASQYTGIDLQSRFSMADMIPGNPAEALAGPQLSRMFQILDSGFGYINNQDTQSFNELMKAAIPSGAYGAYEEANLVDEQGFVLNKKGERKYLEPRTEKERTIRKVLGLRPLRERLYDEQKHYADVVNRKKTEKRNDASERMMTNLALGDDAGFDRAMQTYLENEGDIQNLPEKIKTYAERRNWTSKQRAGGLAPGKSVTSIKKFERYQEKP